MSDPEKQRQNLDPDVEKDIPAPLAEAIKDGRVPEKVLQHSHDADEAMKAFVGHEGEVIHIDAATNKRLLRKIDFNLIPVWFRPFITGVRSSDDRDADEKSITLRSCVSSTG